MLLMFVGFIGSAFTEETQGSLGPGEHLSVAGYRIALIGLRGDSDVEREAVFADLDVRGPDGALGVLSPARFTYNTHPNQPTSEVVIRSDPARDLFLILGETDTANGRAVVRAVINPLVSWIWLGGILLVLGTLVALIRFGRIVPLLEATAEARARFFRPAAIVILSIAIAGIAGVIRDLAVSLVAAGAILVAAAIWFLGHALNGLARSGGER